MALFSRRTGAAAPAAAPARSSLLTLEGSRCASYEPGHQMHYLHQGQALRSESAPARNVIVDGHRVIVILADGAQHDYFHHDPERLGEVLGLFPATRTLYRRFHALRVGPYWFNLAEDAFVPCDDGKPS